MYGNVNSYTYSHSGIYTGLVVRTVNTSAHLLIWTCGYRLRAFW